MLPRKQYLNRKIIINETANKLLQTFYVKINKGLHVFRNKFNRKKNFLLHVLMFHTHFSSDDKQGLCGDTRPIKMEHLR